VVGQTFDPGTFSFVPVLAIEDLPSGERVFLEIDQEYIILFNIEGSYFAIGDVCSHDQGPLGDGTLEGHEISCPRHGASFDVRDGKVISLPAVVNIPSFPTRVLDGQIEIGIPIVG